MIPSVGKQKIVYKNHNTVQFESLDFYLNLAKKIIAKIAPTFFNGLSKEMLRSEDAISFVANAIMMGDWRWKNKINEDNEEKKYKSQYSYRNQCGIWAIKTYVTKKYKQKHSKKNLDVKYSINYADEDISLESFIPDPSQKEPSEIAINTEESLNISNMIQDLLNSELISDKQRQQIIMYYYDNMTLEQIGKKQNITREAVRQSIKSALGKIRSLV